MSLSTPSSDRQNRSAAAGRRSSSGTWRVSAAGRQPASSARRRAVVASVVAASAIAVTACEKPVPSVTVFSGTRSWNEDALCWSRQADQAIRGCDFGNAGPLVTVAPGSTIGVSVDPEATTNGWRLFFDDQPIVTRLLHSTYYRFAVAEQNMGQPHLLRVVAYESAGAQARGYWSFRLDGKG